MVTLNVIADVIVHEKFNLKKRKYEINFIEVLSYTSIKKNDLLILKGNKAKNEIFPKWVLFHN